MAGPEPTHFDRDEREVEFTRALAFSDGVFGIAITLLVVSIDVPNLSGSDLEGQLISALDNLLPFISSYFISFGVVGLLWLRHHRLFSRIRKLDTHVLVVNLVLLSFVALMPFSTEIVGRYGDLPAGVAIYAMNLAVAAGAYTWLWWHCTRAGLLGEEQTPVELRLELRTRLMTSVGFVASIPIAFLVSARIAQLSWLAVVLGQQALIRRYLRQGRIGLSADRDEDD
jgi:uncharacterized membrane protein